LTLKKGIITSYYTAVNANDAEGNAYEFARIFKSAVTRDDADNLLELSVIMPDGNEVKLAK